MPFSARPGFDRPARKGAFTLVELLVSIAIIGILIALLLPAIQQAREAGRRIQCASHIKQIALALQNYENTHKSLPAGGLFASPEKAVTYSYYYWRADLRSGTNQSWVVSLLPYLEEQALHDQFDLTRSVMQNPSNPQAQQPQVLTCPSDNPRGHTFDTVDTTTGNTVQFGKANVAAYTNPFHADAWFYPAAISLYGRRMKQITDGTAATLVFAEIRTRDNAADQRGAWALPWSGSTILAFDFHPGKYPQPAGSKDANPGPYNPNKLSLGQTQRPNSMFGDVLYECPDAAGAQFDQMPCNDQYWGYISAAPRSRHPGGVNVAYLDGHSDFLLNEVDEYAMLYMVNTNDGEVITQPY